MKLSHITARYGELPILENFSLELPDSGVICFFCSLRHRQNHTA